MLHRFTSKHDGAGPAGPLVSVAGELYGTTEFGGVRNSGTIFKISTSGRERVLYAFKGYPDGAGPYGGVTALGNAFYGTTAFGGAFNSSGTVFTVSRAGTERVLHSFSGFPDGAVPFGSLVVAGGTLYGTTQYGGSSSHACITGPYSGCGTVFSIGASGGERVIYRFKGAPDAADPWAGLTKLDGALYGTTLSGGASDQGGIFKVSEGKP